MYLRMNSYVKKLCDMRKMLKCDFMLRKINKIFNEFRKETNKKEGKCTGKFHKNELNKSINFQK